MKIELGGKTLEAIKGDITEFNGDAIVNAANNHFWMGGGVAGAIKRKGGSIIEHEAMKLGPCRPGESIVTGGGELHAKFVIHAAVMGQDLRTDSSLVAAATRSSLSAAETKRVKSIAFPALGTGVGGFPLTDAARIMIAEAADFIRTSGSLERVTFVLYDDLAYSTFTTELIRIKN